MKQYLFSMGYLYMIRAGIVNSRSPILPLTFIFGTIHVIMDKEKFNALLPLIVASLMQKIIEQKKVTQDEAFSLVYNSALYFFLENEQTKVWHYSAEKLFRLFDEELITGKLELPEY